MKQGDTCGRHLQQHRDDYTLPIHHPLSKSFQYRKEKKTLQKVIHLSWKTPDKSLGKMVGKIKRCAQERFRIASRRQRRATTFEIKKEKKNNL